MTQTTTPSMYQKIGGHSAVQAVVDDFYGRVLGDPELAPFFTNTDMARQRRHQVAFVAMALGGPRDYTGKGMREAHRGRGIEDRHFGLVAGHLKDALEAAGVGPEDVATILSVVGGLQAEVVGA
ncbi:MAG: group 1 truncated hemoglobin [Planctomycetes bacterium]|nr:group 1 truncated hemoglobin [Planctomycetota bacterium]MCB9868591.1 group 1 truncated hemoglobin [Planctomycetota bacterium]